MANQSKPNEIRIIRVYDAPVKAVWDAWTDPEQRAQWLGPRGFTSTTHSKDMRPGGIWHYTMYGPDGTVYPNKTVYHEIVEHAKLVYDHGGYDDRPPLFRVTVLFKEVKGKTHMEMTMTLPTAEAAKEISVFIKKAGGNATWDRLAEYLEEQATGKQMFVINRSFAVPIEKMFEMWTDPKHFSLWLPPTGFTMEFIEADIKPGGSTFYCMTGQGNMKMYGKAHYLKIEKPDRLVYTQQFCDEKGNMARHPMAPTWPEFMLTSVEFTAEGPEQTRVTVTWEPHGKFTPEELAVFVQARGGMTQGWTGSFDKLEAYLAPA
ncbi:MAG: SRPBCC domain-containing protein [Planctomycetes bacterium]|nr:SRPBCC domain-containing protein [Planctomycetota bacterium]